VSQPGIPKRQVHKVIEITVTVHILLIQFNLQQEDIGLSVLE